MKINRTREVVESEKLESRKVESTREEMQAFPAVSKL